MTEHLMGSSVQSPAFVVSVGEAVRTVVSSQHLFGGDFWDNFGAT